MFIFMYFKSYKARSVVRSVLGGELIAYRDMIDYAFAFKACFRFCTQTFKLWFVFLLTTNLLSHNI